MRQKHLSNKGHTFDRSISILTAFTEQSLMVNKTVNNNLLKPIKVNDQPYTVGSRVRTLVGFLRGVNSLAGFVFGPFRHDIVSFRGYFTSEQY